MNWHLVALGSVAPQAWRNGAGVTRELLAWPSAQEWKVRLSVADVEAAGPFSRFGGVERWFAVLQGAGVALRIAGREHRLTSGSPPLRFDGGATVDCELIDGATRDFNLMAPPQAASMRRVHGEDAWRAEAGMLLAAYAHAQPALLSTGGDTLELPRQHLAWCILEHSASGSVRSADALWVEAAA